LKRLTEYKYKRINIINSSTIDAGSENKLDKVTYPKPPNYVPPQETENPEIVPAQQDGEGQEVQPVEGTNIEASPQG
jgi:hypothetical protein